MAMTGFVATEPALSTPTMDRCKTCKHWAPCASFAHWGNDKKSGGICSSDKITEDAWQGHGADMMVYLHFEGGEFWTGPDFGCVHHQNAEGSCSVLKNLIVAIEEAFDPEERNCFSAYLGNAIDAARAAVDNPPASAWQPIETAPRDGTKFLAWDGDELLIVWWCDGGRWISDNLQQYHPGEYENPTHWQPLPSPPPITP